MGISVAGNITYINQNTQASSIQLANAQARNDLLQQAHKEDFDRKLQEIESIPPTSHTQETQKDSQNNAQQDARDSPKPHHQDKEEIGYHYDGILNVKA